MITFGTKPSPELGSKSLQKIHFPVEMPNLAVERIENQNATIFCNRKFGSDSFV